MISVQLIIFGVMLLFLGIFTIRRRRYAHEEGMRGPVLIKGKIAAWIGILQIIFGLAMFAAAFKQWG